MSIFIYIAAPGTESIYILKLSQKKYLTKIQQINTEGEPQPILLLPEKNLLYVGIRPKNRIDTYYIDNEKKIYKVHSIQLEYPINHISTDQTKNFLFCSSYHGNLIYLISLNHFGYPEHILFTIKNIYGCHFSQVDIENKILFSTALKENKIYMHKISEMIENNTINFKKHLIMGKNSGPRHLSFHPTKKYLYSINEFNGTVDVINIHNMENINIIQNINMLPIEYTGKFWGADIHITQCGKFLYATDRSANILTVFSVHEVFGTLKIINHYITEKQPRSFHIDHNDQYLFIVGQQSNSLTVYHMNDKTGLLHFLNNFSINNNPLWVTTY
ncbi:6-phosphogluconolactonase [Buchnera aphidicola (Thelaxes californica)]|uniref:6-phosphogluconolactonase n=1 Tax=Buchnera aphidicola (Thelaxes californica) TaxID=1315998 RepID=A0A4D6YLA3_9GAMM|nr:beta-propeller fold lactonase family protein [Buchnera aphidicola]QCI26760.1 6-phosphogluconolactonase [Buchnera aphidicola (Thelaxes californica)]